MKTHVASCLACDLVTESFQGVSKFIAVKISRESHAGMTCLYEVKANEKGSLSEK